MKLYIAFLVLDLSASDSLSRDAESSDTEFETAGGRIPTTYDTEQLTARSQQLSRQSPHTKVAYLSYIH